MSTHTIPSSQLPQAILDRQAESMAETSGRCTTYVKPCCDFYRFTVGVNLDDMNRLLAEGWKVIDNTR